MPYVVRVQVNPEGAGNFCRRLKKHNFKLYQCDSITGDHNRIHTEEQLDELTAKDGQTERTYIDCLYNSDISYPDQKILSFIESSVIVTYYSKCHGNIR